MGGCASGVEHNETHLLPFLKRDEFALEMFTKIGLTNAEVRKFCVMFEEINTDKSGVVTSVDVLSYLDMDSDDLTIKILSPFDVENLGTLTFCEFTCALWNFLSLDTRNLPSFLFHLFDQERLFILNYSQIKLVLKMIHQQSCSDKVIVKKLLEELQDLTPITRPIFRKYCQRNPFLCQPVVALQHLMRKNVFGEIFWATLCRRRLGDTNLLEADSLFKIRDHTTKKMVNLNRSGLPPDTQDRLDGISKIREKALEKYHEQKKNITEGNNTKGLKDLGKSNSKLSNKNINKIVPINNRIREISEDPVELLSTSPPFRKITLLDLEEHAIDSDGESPSLCPTSSSIISKNSPIPVINKVVVTNSNRGTKRSGYSSISRKSKSVLKRESTYLASDSAEESESSGGSDLERVRTRRRYKKNRPKKTVRFSDINTYIYPEGTISSQNQESKLTLSPSSPSSISHTPVMEDFNLVQLTPDE